MFRISGNINVENTEVVPGQKFRLNVGNKKSGLSFIQYLNPLNNKQPYFYVHIINAKSNSNITIGIASLDISENISPGSWNNTVGYESLSGKCLSSHRANANTTGSAVLKGDTFGLYVSHFGLTQSTVIFLLNNKPVASRYHFENDHNKYLPTITFENGPIDVEIYWPHCSPDFLQEKKMEWIKPSEDICLNFGDGIYENLGKLEDMSLQQPMPLGRTHPQYKCVQLDVSPDGQGSSVGIASCSPLKPTPTCSLLRDYYTWLPKMKHTPNANDKAEQLALVFVTFNDSVVDVLFVLQPEGGFFPLVLMQPWSRKVKVEMLTSISAEDTHKLTRLFHSKLTPAIEVYNKGLKDSVVSLNDIRKQSDEISVTIERTKTVVKIPASRSTHFIQYQKALTSERRFFFLEIIKLGLNSNLVLGVAPLLLAGECPSKLPGEEQETIGYHSKTGLMFYNGKSQGNMMGHKCRRGDSMGIEIEIFEAEPSVAIFSKNFKPVGTRYLTLEDSESFLPTVAIQSSGEPIELNIYWQTVVSMPPHFNVRNPDDWCVPEGTKIDQREKIFNLPPHQESSLCIQAPYSLHQKYNHFEIILMDNFDKNNPPPAIALCTACPFDPPPASQFKQDYLRFWPAGEAMSAVRKNDRLGWGIFYTEDDLAKDREQLIICFLTINRQVVYLRVLFQPPGGFYPVVIAPPNVNRIKMDFTATRVSTEDFASEQISSIISEANKQILSEKRMIAQGKNPREQRNDSRRSKMCSII